MLLAQSFGPSADCGFELDSVPLTAPTHPNVTSMSWLWIRYLLGALSGISPSRIHHNAPAAAVGLRICNRPSDPLSVLAYHRTVHSPQDDEVSGRLQHPSSSPPLDEQVILDTKPIFTGSGYIGHPISLAVEVSDAHSAISKE